MSAGSRRLRGCLPWGLAALVATRTLAGAAEKPAARLVELRLEVAHSAIGFTPRLAAIVRLAPGKVAGVEVGQACLAEVVCTNDACGVTAVVPQTVGSRRGALHVGCTVEGTDDSSTWVRLAPFPLAISAEAAEAVRYEESSTAHIMARYHSDPNGALHFVTYAVLARTTGPPIFRK